MEFQVRRSNTVATLSINQTIKVSRDKAFNAFTTNDITNWFSELSFDTNPPQTLLFNMGETQLEMNILSYTALDHIHFEWATGDVHIQFIGEVETCIQFKEQLPLTFEHISRDFAGWLAQIENVTHFLETDTTKSMDMNQFTERKEEIEMLLK